MKQFNIKTIVVGLDFSWYSKIVLKEALQLSQKMKVPLVAVYVGEKPYAGLNASRFPTHQLIKWYKEKLRKEYPSLKPRQITVKLGVPHEEIIQAARSHKKPLIVIGHRGQSPLARFIIGSVAEKLSQTSPYPVWVHRGEKTVSPKKVLLPCDLQRRSSIMAEYLAPLSKIFHSKFELFHAFQEPAPVLDYELWSAMIETQRQSENQQIDRLKKKYPKTPVKCVIGLPAKQIVRRAKAFDLIALPRRNQKARSPFFGSVTRKLVRDAETPLLILP